MTFVPQPKSESGALTKYVEKVAGDDDFKIRGIEARQRSTPPFIEDVQRDCLDRLDSTRSPDAVLDCLQDAIKRLHAGTVPVEQLVERNRVSKPLEGYTQRTRNVAALKRARDQDLAVHPGQDIEYVVVDDEKSSRERVALGSRRDQIIRCVVLRNGTRQSCRECAVTAWLGSLEDSSRTDGDSGTGAGVIRERDAFLTNISLSERTLLVKQIGSRHEVV